MVNDADKGISTKAYLLERLRGSRDTLISGEAMAKELKVSRVAVWKAVQALKKAGYPVAVENGGYRLSGGDQDFLYPWEFGERENLFRHWVSTDSTMNRAKELAQEESPSGTVITAERQTAGRGRNGRNWVSNPGGLFFTLLVRPGCTVREYSLYTMAVHIAAAETLSALCGKEARLRWPNDVYIGDKKIGGILSEFHGEGDFVSWLNLGVGLNINNRVSPPESVSCLDLLGHPLSRKAVLVQFLEGLARIQRSAPSLEELTKQWNRNALGRGGQVLIIPGDHPRRDVPWTGPVPGENRGRGRFWGIDASGRGIVKTPLGTIRISPASASLYFIK
ncbi:MAG: biotin--[acetyl-CoA-carboxylase] ligase [Spirochaetaceae bacterium]|jgi:BirA family biotin operon repressor/biotin-[acetyl-CoA-carboxylase] ligase|nr:biotin--[acetyl-CoA-carboxylase] ligase [Spirochaetaceae bacterium]